jgi:hypothetical protein
VKTLDNISSFLIAALPILGIVIGASLQYFFSKSSEARRQLTTLRNQAYIDYLQCFAEIKHVGQVNSESRGKILAKATEAKTRIIIYGSTAVVEALIRFEKLGATLDSPEAIEAFLVLCSIMRKENIGRFKKTKPKELSVILFNSKQ